MRRRGFTLLETLVALAITALVLAALGGTVLRAAAARTRATTVADRTGGARTTLLRLASELEAALPAEGASIEAFVLDAPDRDGGSSTLRFTTVGPPPRSGPASDTRTITYRVGPDPGDNALPVLVRRTGDTPARPRDEVVLERVRRFTVRGFDGTRWVPAWHEPRLPRAVEVRIVLDDDPHGDRELATTVTLAAGG